MIMFKCKCGGTWMGSNFIDVPAPCDGCDLCNTTLERAGDEHKIRQPHTFITASVDTDEGPKPLTRCSRCGAKKEAEQ